MWTTQTRDGALVGHITGRIDELHWEAFSAALNGAVAEAVSSQLDRLILDLSGVDYMSSRGLRALTLGKREADAGNLAIILAAPGDIVREILAISRYDKLFSIVDTVDAALEG